VNKNTTQKTHTVRIIKDMKMIEMMKEEFNLNKTKTFFKSMVCSFAALAKTSWTLTQQKANFCNLDAKDVESKLSISRTEKTKNQ